MSSLRILIVDDIKGNVQRLTRLLNEAGYSNIEGVSDPTTALKRVREYEPDLIILELMMSGTDGYAILSDLQQVAAGDEFLPVLVTTADHNESAREQALALGATDFLVRPHRVFDVTLRVRNLLRARELHLKYMERSRGLESLVNERTQHLQEIAERLEVAQTELRLAKQDVIERLALMGEHHDDDTGMHTYRVANSSFLIGQQMGMPFEEANVLQLAALLHDVGKIAIPDSILLKPGRLRPEEFEKMKTHCEIGGQILAGGQSELLRVAHQIALSHHERWDGQGYPRGLRGEEIPLVGRIVAVADVFDALTHDRPYKAAWSVSEASAEISRQSGAHFDPQVVAAFAQLDHIFLVHPPLRQHMPPTQEW